MPRGPEHRNDRQLSSGTDNSLGWTFLLPRRFLSGLTGEAALEGRFAVRANHWDALPVPPGPALSASAGPLGGTSKADANAADAGIRRAE